MRQCRPIALSLALMSIGSMSLNADAQTSELWTDQALGTYDSLIWNAGTLRRKPDWSTQTAA
jgi:hypothetical protein